MCQQSSGCLSRSGFSDTLVSLQYENKALESMPTLQSAANAGSLRQGKTPRLQSGKPKNKMRPTPSAFVTRQIVAI